jgi:hypothetical protein
MMAIQDLYDQMDDEIMISIKPNALRNPGSLCHARVRVRSGPGSRP